MYNKGDFAHQQITTAAILAPGLDKDGLISNLYLRSDDEYVTDKAGWLGDATLGKPISFGPDDYKADLDAENIAAELKKDHTLSYIDAVSKYYYGIANGESRTAKFLEKHSLSEVVDKIYEEHYHVPKKDPIVLTMDEKVNEIKKKAPDAYNFIMSLENSLQEMNDYARTEGK